MRKFRTLSRYPMAIAGRWMFVSAIDILFAVVVLLLGYPREWAMLCLALSLVPPVVESTHSLLKRWQQRKQRLLAEDLRKRAMEAAVMRAQIGIQEMKRTREQQRIEMLKRQEEENARNLVYFIVDREGDRVKIGVSANPRSRLGNLQTSNSHTLELALTLPGGYSLEQQLHAQYAEHRIRGEWFHLAPEILERIEGPKARKPRKQRYVREPASVQIALSSGH